MIRALALAALCAVILTASAQAGKYNSTLSIGDKAPAWEDLPGVDGKRHSLSDLKGKGAVVVVFTCNSCPYAVDYEDRLIAFARKHAGPDGDVGLVAINVNKTPADSFEKMQERAKEKGFPFPYLYDETQQIAKDYGAIFTPEFYVLDEDRRVVYMGSMDDHPQAEKVTRSYLEPAVAAALTGETPETTETPAVGCRVRYERKRRR